MGRAEEGSSNHRRRSRRSPLFLRQARRYSLSLYFVELVPISSSIALIPVPSLRLLGFENFHRIQRPRRTVEIRGSGDRVPAREASRCQRRHGPLRLSCCPHNIHRSEAHSPPGHSPRVHSGSGSLLLLSCSLVPLLLSFCSTICV